MNRILVIGGTGTVGRQVVSQLLAAGAKVRALVRNRNAAKLPPQVELVRGDLTLPHTLDGSLKGIDRVFLVWTDAPAAVAPALERITKQVRHIVSLSAPLKRAQRRQIRLFGGQPITLPHSVRVLRRIRPRSNSDSGRIHRKPEVSRLASN